MAMMDYPIAIAVRIMLLVMIWAVWMLSGCVQSQKGAATQSIETITVKPEPLTIGIDDVGILKARRTKGVYSPEYGMIAKMVPEGETVTEGQPVVWLEQKEITQFLQQELIQEKQNKTNLDRRLESLRESRSKYAQVVKERQAIYTFDQVQLQMAETELERQQDRFARKLIPESDLQEAMDIVTQKRLKLKYSETALRKAEETHQSNVRNLQLEVEIAEKEFELSTFQKRHYQDLLEKAILKAPCNGILIYRTRWSGEKFQVGDQVWGGMMICEIPDLSEMIVQSQISEIHYDNIHIGQTVFVRVDALDNMLVNGKITSIGSLAIPRKEAAGGGFLSDQSMLLSRVFEIEIAMDKQDERFRPGMGVSVTVVQEHFEKVLSVPISAVSMELEESYVYVQSHRSFAKTRVKPGKSNRERVIIEEGLREGDVVATIVPPMT